jgi:exoribonuclease R
VQKEANELIEEFMLLANRSVAEFIGMPKEEKKKGGKSIPGKPFVYRVHDKPDPEKLSDFARFASQFGYSLKFASEQQVSSSLNQLMKDVKGKGEQNVIETLAIRTMAKAVYTTNNIGHYGLAFKHYTHFTSPIRRYPDVMVHRLLDAYMQGKNWEGESQLELRCKHSSDMEKLAAEAERFEPTPTIAVKIEPVDKSCVTVPAEPADVFVFNFSDVYVRVVKPDILKSAPIFKVPPIPTPPETTNAPDEDEVETVVLVILTVPPIFAFPVIPIPP